METSGRPDFSGAWRQVKNENFDGFLKVSGVGAPPDAPVLGAPARQC
jgi:hypothetical protein